MFNRRMFATRRSRGLFLVNSSLFFHVSARDTVVSELASDGNNLNT